MEQEGRVKPVTFNQLVLVEGQDSTAQMLDHYIAYMAHLV